jgi:hypothetical protein
MDFLCDRIGLRGSVEHDDTLGEDLGDLAVGAVDVGGEFISLALDAVG